MEQAPAVTEDDLLGNVQEMARKLGLMTHHQLTHCARCGQALSFHRAGDAGFPDLVIAGTGGELFRELKSAFGTMRPGQTRWRYQLQAGGADFATWRPVDWISGRIENQLRVIAGAPIRITDR